MYVKAVILQGFRTYRFETRISFSPGYNCIVGSNGSGKSNILLGIAFALGEGGHAAAERRLLLHEGAGERVAEGSVEVLLSNEDRRLCMYDEDEISVRRVFSATSDEFYVQNKRVNKAGLQQLLECAGFSRSQGGCGPTHSSSGLGTSGRMHAAYYIPQGKIIEAAVQSSCMRLQLLQQAAGGGLFAVKAKETEQLLQQGQQQALRLADSIQLLSSKLKAVALEREELQQCLLLEKQKDCLQYVLSERAWGESNKELQELSGLVNRESEKLKILEKQAAESETVKQQLQQQQQHLVLQQRMQTEARDSALQALSSWRVEEEAVRLQLTTAQATEQQQQQHQKQSQQLLLSLKEKLNSLESELQKKLQPELSEALQKLQAAQQRLQQTQQQYSALQCKQGVLLARRLQDNAAAPKITTKKGPPPTASSAAETNISETECMRSTSSSSPGGRGHRRRKQQKAAALSTTSSSFSSSKISVNNEESTDSMHLSLSEVDIHREIRHAEALSKEESELLKWLKSEIERLESEQKKLEDDAQLHSAKQKTASERLQKAEGKEKQLSNAFEKVAEELRLQQGNLSALLQEQTLQSAALQEAESRFWQQLRTDVREGLQAALRYVAAQQQNWGCSSAQFSSYSNQEAKSALLDSTGGSSTTPITNTTTNIASDCYGATTSSSSGSSNSSSSAATAASQPSRCSEENAPPPRLSAGLLLDFIHVAPEYRRAVEAIGAHALTSFLVPDAAAVSALLQYLKNPHSLSSMGPPPPTSSDNSSRSSSSCSSTNKNNISSNTRVVSSSGGGGGFRRGNVSLTIVPLQQVAELQRQKETSSRLCKRQKQQLQELEAEGKAFSIANYCIEIPAAAEGSSATRSSATEQQAAEVVKMVAAYVRSVFGKAVLVPSLRDEDASAQSPTGHSLVRDLLDSGFDCVTVDGDVAFSSGVLRGGGGGGSGGYGKTSVALTAAGITDTKNTDHSNNVKRKNLLQSSNAEEASRKGIAGDGGGGVGGLSVPVPGKIQAYEALQRQKRACAELQQQIAQTQQTVHTLQTKHAELIEEEQIFSEARAEAHACLREVLDTRQQTEARLRTLQQRRAALKTQAQETASRSDGLKSLIQTLRRESLSPDSNMILTEKEQQLLLKLPQQLREAEQQLEKDMCVVEAKEAALQQALAHRDGYLYKQIERLEREAAEGVAAEAAEQQREFERRLTALNRWSLQADETARQAERKLQLLDRELRENKDEQQRVEQQQSDILRLLDNTLQTLQRYSYEAQAARRSLDEAEAVLRGAAAAAGEGAAAALPLQQLQHLRTLSDDQLSARSRIVTKKLKQFSHVNRKAVDQIAVVQEDYENLLERQQQQQQTRAFIEHQLQQLCSKKQQLTLQMIQQVAAEMKTIFAALCPGGHAELVLVRGGVAEEEEAASGADKEGASRNQQQQRQYDIAGLDKEEFAKNIVGVDIQVTFTDQGKQQSPPIGTDAALEGVETAVFTEQRKHPPSSEAQKKQKEKKRKMDKGMSIQQLSGGQKSLVALALLLALQRISFRGPTTALSDEQKQQQQSEHNTRTSKRSGGVLLLDEIDAALDETHRKVAAAVFRDNVDHNNTQLIITSFRPELVIEADRIYRIKQINRISYVEVVDAEQALAVLQENQHQGPYPQPQQPLLALQ